MVTPRTKPKTRINLGLNSEFNPIHFGIEINQRLKFLTLRHKIFVSEYFWFFWKKNFFFFQQKNLWVLRILNISWLKCRELNSEFKPKLILVLVLVWPKTKTQYIVFFCSMPAYGQFFLKIKRAKSGFGPWSVNMVSQNTFKNIPEDDLGTFCDMISYLTSKYRPDFLETSKIAEPDLYG